MMITAVFLLAVLVLLRFNSCTSSGIMPFTRRQSDDSESRSVTRNTTQVVSPGMSLGHRQLGGSECHFEVWLGKTKCVHHDGTVWIAGDQQGSAKSTSKPSSSSSSGISSIRGSSASSSSTTSRSSSSSSSSSSGTSALDRSTAAFRAAAMTKKDILAKQLQRNIRTSSSTSTSSISSLSRTSSSLSSPPSPSLSSASAKLSRSSLSSTGTGIGGGVGSTSFSPSRPSSASSRASSPWIASCFDRGCSKPWLDSHGKRIEAHGGGMLQDGNGTFYWYGESEKMTDKTRGYGYSNGVNCYSAKSLGGPWHFEGLVFGQSSIWTQELSDKDRPFIIERPKVLFNAKTQKFVLWFHLDAADLVENTRFKSGGGGGGGGSGAWRRRRLENDEEAEDVGFDYDGGERKRGREAVGNGISTTGGDDDGGGGGGGVDFLSASEKEKKSSHRRQPGDDEEQQGRRRLLDKRFRHHYWFRRAGVAMADSPNGPFRFVHALKPDGLSSLDLQLFEEADGKSAFLIRSVNNEYVGMSRLTDDYLSTTGRVLSTIQPALEGMAVFRHPADHTLYAVMSHLTGWEPNPLVLLRAHKKGAGSGGAVGERCQLGCTLDDADLVWEKLGNPTHHHKSFNAQPTFVMSLVDKQRKPYVMLMSDNWLYAGNRGLKDAGYIWLPLEFRKNATVGIRKMRNWTMNAPFERYN